MFVLDLRWLIFGFLLLFSVATPLAIWLDRWLRWRRAEGWAAWDQAPFGLLVLDGPRTVCYANPYACRLLDIASPAGPLPEADWRPLLEQDRQAMRVPGPVFNRTRTLHLPEERIARWWVARWGSREIVFLLDVTAQQRAEQIAGHLLSDLSHELRTPLATILTHLEVLLLPNLSTELGQQSLHLLKEEGRRMARLLNDMLELGRLETSGEIERRPVDLLGVVEQVITQVAPRFQERGMSLALEVGAPLPLVAGDEDRLRQVFLNLLDNVVQHCRPGDQAWVALRPEGRGVVCTVRDNGPGIPAQHLPHVTRRFYRGTPQGQGGSGLGLSLVVEILRRHGSRLEIDSVAEGDETGTRVRFVLPVPPGEEEGQ